MNNSTDSARDHVEMALKAAEAFANDGKLDARELTAIIDIAERDSVIDQEEIRVLRNIIARLEPAEVTPALRAKLAELFDKVNNQG
ncbi:hypothetical protein [Arenicella chitinivorans]|nr:hypothetical protein [Arenicella chitinivorans]